MTSEEIYEALVARETKRLEGHQATKVQADLSAYMRGYEMGVRDAINACEAANAE